MRMANFVISPASKGYWIEKVTDEGMRMRVEWCKTEQEALETIKEFQRQESLNRPPPSAPSKRIWP